MMREGSTEDQRKLSKKGVYTLVYDKKREELDLENLNNMDNTVKRKYPKF
jgi:hypothetical protein